MAYLAYTTREGDRLDLIANKAYGDPLGFLEILEANPQAAIYAVYPAGVELNIPIREEVEIEAETNLPPWKRA